MIVVDTNVLSELMRPRPDPLIVVWASKHFRADAYTTAITKAEMLAGILRMPSGRRREQLADYVNEMLSDVFHDRILAFDSACAERYAEIVDPAFSKAFPSSRPMLKSQQSPRWQVPRSRRATWSISSPAA